MKAELTELKELIKKERELEEKFEALVGDLDAVDTLRCDGYGKLLGKITSMERIVEKTERRLDFMRDNINQLFDLVVQEPQITTVGAIFIIVFSLSISIMAILLMN
jgi:hypothetical protein